MKTWKSPSERRGNVTVKCKEIRNKLNLSGELFRTTIDQSNINLSSNIYRHVTTEKCETRSQDVEIEKDEIQKSLAEREESSKDDFEKIDANESKYVSLLFISLSSCLKFNVKSVSKLCMSLIFDRLETFSVWKKRWQFSKIKTILESNSYLSLNPPTCRSYKIEKSNKKNCANKKSGMTSYRPFVTTWRKICTTVE